MTLWSQFFDNDSYHMPCAWDESGLSDAADQLRLDISRWNLEDAARSAVRVRQVLWPHDFEDQGGSDDTIDRGSSTDWIVRRLGALPEAMADPKVDLRLTSAVADELRELVAFTWLVSDSEVWWGNIAALVLTGRYERWTQLDEELKSVGTHPLIEEAIEVSGLQRKSILKAPWASSSDQVVSRLDRVGRDGRAVLASYGATRQRLKIGLHLVSKRALLSESRLKEAFVALVDAEFAEVPASVSTILLEWTAEQLREECESAGLRTSGSKSVLVDRFCAALDEETKADFVGSSSSSHILDIGLGPTDRELADLRPRLAVWCAAIDLLIDEQVGFDPSYFDEDGDEAEPDPNFFLVAGAGHNERLYDEAIAELPDEPQSRPPWSWWRWAPLRQMTPYRTVIASPATGLALDARPDYVEVADMKGNLLWRRQGPRDALLPVTVDGVELLAEIESGVLRCCRLADGVVLWTSDPSAGVLRSDERRIATSAGQLLIDGEESRVTARDVRDGLIVWRFELDGERWCNDLRIVETAHGPLLLIVTDGGVECRDASSGELCWHFARSGVAYVLSAGGQVAVPVSGATVVLDLLHGTEIARHRLSRPRALAGGAVLFESVRPDRILLRALEAETGDELWARDDGIDVLRYVSDIDGRYFGLEDHHVDYDETRRRPNREPMLVDPLSGEPVASPADGSFPPFAVTEWGSEDVFGWVWYQSPGDMRWRHDVVGAPPAAPDWADLRIERAIATADGGWIISSPLGYGKWAPNGREQVGPCAGSTDIDDRHVSRAQIRTWPS